MSFTKTFPLGALINAVGNLRVWNYGNYAEPKGSFRSGSCKNNYGAHSMAFEIHNIRFYFSYETLVGFYHHTAGLNLRANEWGPTTGGHLREIEDDCRTVIAHTRLLANLTEEEFYATLYNVLRNMDLAIPSLPLPKHVFALGDTNEIIDGTPFDDLSPLEFTNKMDKVRTPGRVELREAEKRHARQVKAARKAAAKQAAATRKLKQKKAKADAEFARKAQAIMADVALNNEDLSGEEMFA